MELHEIFKQHREQLGIKRRHLYVKTGIQGNQIKLFEEGRKDFSLRNALKLFNAIGMKFALVEQSNNG